MRRGKGKPPGIELLPSHRSPSRGASAPGGGGQRPQRRRRISDGGGGDGDGDGSGSDDDPWGELGERARRG
eukprot:15481726-Alexandrium_andersonii.AAC.1